jgi:hypothetical protein
VSLTNLNLVHMLTNGCRGKKKGKKEGRDVEDLEDRDVEELEEREPKKYVEQF